MFVRWLILSTTLALGACGADRVVADREVFDEQTGNTLTVVSKPLVFSRERNDLAAHARDYATVVAVEVDHSGTADLYLLLYRWSTVDKRMLAEQGLGGGRLRLVGSGRELNLAPLHALPVGIGSTLSLHRPPHAAALTWAYVVDLDVLRFIAVTGSLTLQMPDESLETPFQVWDDGRPALGRFLQHASVP